MCHYWRLILKWLLVIGTFALLFKLSCDSLVDTFVYVSHSSLVNMFKRDAHTRYERSLTAWITNGQPLTNGKLLSESIKKRHDLQLIGAQIFFRHGARTPLHLLPGLDEVVYKDEQLDSYRPSKWDIKLIPKRGSDTVSKDKILSANDVIGSKMKKLKSLSGKHVMTGQLTAVGEKQLFQLGRLIKSELLDYNNNELIIPATYDSAYVYCRSTYMNRTISSARSFLAGLFSSDKINNKIQADGPFEIEVQHYLEEDLFPNPNIFPVLNKCHNITSLYTSLNDDHDLKRARKAMLQHFGLTTSSYGIVELYDDVVSRKAHSFPVPEDILQLVKDFEVMSAREYIYRATNIGFELFIRSTCGPVLISIRENFDLILKNYLEQKTSNLKKPYHKFFIYSGHDSTLIPLALALEIFDMYWPRYASYILLKFYVSKTDANEAYVTINFNGAPRLLPDCQEHYCSYAVFLKSLQNLFSKPQQSLST